MNGEGTVARNRPGRLRGSDGHEQRRDENDRRTPCTGDHAGSKAGGTNEAASALNTTTAKTETSMRTTFLTFVLFLSTHLQAQSWHLNTEPVYFLAKAPNLALDRNLGHAWAVGFQYSALDWAKNGSNLSGVQAFYSRTSSIGSNSEILKLYVGRLSPRTTILKIETKEAPLPLFEVLYGYRWVKNGRWTIAVLGGTFFTTSRIYPSVSVPIGWMF